jgi:hypothetical protein
MRRLIRALASDRGDADPLMTVFSVGVSALLTTVVAGALSVIVLVASGFVTSSITRSDTTQAQQLWTTSMEDASTLSVLGTDKVIAYSFPDSRPGTYMSTAQDQTCVKTTWSVNAGQLNAVVERWGNSDCDRTNTTAAATSKVTAVSLPGVSDLAVAATNVGGRDLRFTAAGAEVGATSTTAPLMSTNPRPGAGGVSDAEWKSTAPRAINLTGKLTALAGAVNINWQATTSLRPSVTTASVDEGLRFTPMTPVRFSLGSISATPVVTAIAGTNGIPADAVAVAMNVEVTGPSANLYAHVTPAGTDYDVAQVWSKSGVAGSQYATVKLAGGKVQTMVSTGTATMFLDVSGYYSKDSAASAYFPKAATRTSASLTTAYKAVTLAGVPANATAVAVNVQIVSPSATGYARVTANGAPDGASAQQYFTASADTSNLITMGITNGALQAKLSAGTATAYFDVVGYYAKDPAGATYVPVDFTTRTWSGALSTTKVQVQVANAAGVPTNASAVIANLYLTAITTSGYVRVNSGTDDATLIPQRPVGPGASISTPVQAALTDGQINIKASAGTATGWFDVSGYFQPAA